MQTIGITVTWIVRRPFEVSHYAAKEDLGGQLTVVTCPVWLTVTPYFTTFSMLTSED